MQSLIIEAKKRKTDIKNVVRKSLRANFIPAILYNKKENFSIEVNRHDFEKIFQKLEVNSILKFKLDGQEMSALLKDYQFSLRTRQLTHLDFYLIDEAHEIKIRVPLDFIGRSKGVVRGGVIQTFATNILVKCKLADVPKSIEVDISNLDIGDNILLKEIALPENIKPLEGINKNLISILSTKASAVSDETDAMGKDVKEKEPTTETAATS